MSTTAAVAAVVEDDDRVPPQPPDVYCPSMGDIKPVPTPFTEDLVTDVNVILVTATEVEFCAVMGQANDANSFRKVSHNNVTFYLGFYGLCKVSVVRTGLTGRRARENLDKVQEIIRARYVIAVGICYGMKKDKVKPGDVIVAESIFDTSVKRAQGKIMISRINQRNCGEYLCRIFRESVGFDLKNGSGSVRIKFGPLVSEPTLVASQEYKGQILKQIPQALGGEMEGNGIMKPAEAGRFEGIVIKAVADYGNEDKEPYREWQEFAATAAAKYVLFRLQEGDICANIKNRNPMLHYFIGKDIEFYSIYDYTCR
jgi:nucleoside phosphorylase